MTRILIVDDSAFLRSSLKRHLSGAASPLGADTVLSEAASKAEALRKVQEEHPDLVLLDIVMDQGDRDGVEVLAAIKHSGIPARVIMTSAVGQERVINECMDLGASGYILKPFDEQQVLDAIACALGGRLETAAVEPRPEPRP